MQFHQPHMGAVAQITAGTGKEGHPSSETTYDTEPQRCVIDPLPHHYAGTQATDTPSPSRKEVGEWVEIQE